MRSRSVLASFVAAAALVAACAGDTVSPTGSVLSGLFEVVTHDSSNTQGEQPVTGSGFFQGTVMAPSLPGAGNDSLTTAPRISGVVVTIYPKLASTGDESVDMGPAAGSVTTGADGHFTLPTLPAGDYIVTFVPPVNSGYYGSYAFGPLRSNSSSFSWWIVLAKK